MYYISVVINNVTHQPAEKRVANRLAHVRIMVYVIRYPKLVFAHLA
jgi:hypothetical protein